MRHVHRDNHISVNYEEFEGSPVLSFSSASSRIRKIYKIAWDKIGIFIKELMGWTEYIEGTRDYPEVSITHEPHYCKVPGSTCKIYASEIEDIRGWPFGAMVEVPTSTKTAEYKYAIVTVRYDWSFVTPEEDQPIISERIEPAAEFMTLSGTKLFWGPNDPIAETEAPAMIYRMMDWVYTFHRMPFIPSALIELIGFINDAPITSRTLGLTFQRGTVLLGNPSISREYTFFETTMWEITVRLTICTQDWNLFPRTNQRDAAGNTMFLHIRDADNQVLYPYHYGNFRNVII